MLNFIAKPIGVLRGWAIPAGAAVYGIAFGVFAHMASRHSSGSGLAAAITFVEAAVLAAVAVLAAAEMDPKSMGVRRFLGRLVLVCGVAIGVSAIVLGVSALMWDSAPTEAAVTAFRGALLAQLVIFAFCVLLGGIYAIVRCLGAEPFLSQLVCMAVGCLLLGTVFYADPVVVWAGDEARPLVIRLILGVNPTTAISSSLLGIDVMRHRLMYDQISVIGRYYQTPYPAWWVTAGGYIVVATVFLGLAGTLRHLRKKEAKG